MTAKLYREIQVGYGSQGKWRAARAAAAAAARAAAAEVAVAAAVARAAERREYVVAKMLPLLDDLLAIGPAAPVELACSVDRFNEVFAPKGVAL